MFIAFCSFKFALVLRNKTCPFGLQRLSLFTQVLNFALYLGYICSGLMKPDTHLGENARHREVSDDQATSYLYP